MTYEEVVVTGFTRGEQLVELAALDPATYEYNFYLLRFAQACNRTRCTPEDLLTEKIESGWTDWTLYSDRDLEDTPLDCASCHLPFGAGTHKMLLMRQVPTPGCTGAISGAATSARSARQPDWTGPSERSSSSPRAWNLLRAVEGAAGRYAGVPVAELHAAESGKVFAKFVVDAEGLIRRQPLSSFRLSLRAGSASRPARSLCERFHTGTSPTWDRPGAKSFARGLPVPYYGPDVVDAQRRAEVARRSGRVSTTPRGRRRFRRRGLVHRRRGRGRRRLRPATGQTRAPEILRAMCVRCHAAATDPRLRRARFNAEAIDQIEPRHRDRDSPAPVAAQDARPS